MKTLPAGGSSQHFYLFLYVYVLLSVAFFIIYFHPPLPTTCTCVPSTSTLLPNNAVLSKPMRIAPANSKPATAGLHKPVRAEDIVAECANAISDAFPKKNQSFFVPRDHVVNKLDPAWLIQAPPCPLDGPSLLVVIPSMDGDKNRRKAIRETWAGPAYGRAWPGSRRAWGHSNSTVKVVFFLGVSTIYTQQTVEQEAEAHQDIVRADFTEAYQNLSLKMNVVLHWVATFCPGARHVIKVDQDTFVNLPLLLDVLELLSAKRSRFVLGRKHGAIYPPVVRWGRWKVSEDIYPLASFPRYMLGHSYVISGEAIKPLHYAAQRIPLVPNEDAYVTGILAKSANVSRVHCSRMSTSLQANGCGLVTGAAISQTGFWGNSAIYRMWDRIYTGNCSTS